MYYHPILNVQYHSILQSFNFSMLTISDLMRTQQLNRLIIILRNFNRKKIIRGRIGIKNSQKFTTMILIEFMKSLPRFHFLNYVHKRIKIHKLK